MSGRIAAVALRAATPVDVVEVHRLEQELFGADAWSPGLVAAALQGPGRHVVVAEVDGAVAAYAVTAIAGEVADLERVAVAPAHRRAGVATALLEAVRSEAVQAGAHRLLLEVSEANTGAREFYAAAQAVEIDRRRRYYRDGADALVLELPLAPGEERRG